MNSKVGFLGELGIILLFIVFCCLAVFFAQGSSGVVMQSKKMPNLSIVLNGVTLDIINNNSKNIKYPGNTVVVGFDGKETTYENVKIKGRGNYTWKDSKRPYQIKFKEKVELLDGVKSKKWILLANNMDDSVLRNQLAFYLNGIIDKEYPIDGSFFKINIDGEEQGLYLVTNKIEIDKNSVDLKNQHGVLVELDNVYCFDEDIQYKTKDGNCLALKEAVSDKDAEDAFYSFVKDFELFELAAKNGNFEEVKKIIDVESFVNYFMISELSANPDAYITSFYLYKDGDEDLIHAGPSWDFDGAFGNLNWENGGREEWFYDPETPMVRREQAFGSLRYDSYFKGDIEVAPNDLISKIMYYLIDIPEFYELVCDKYEGTIKNRAGEIISYIENKKMQIRDEAIEDNNKWKKNDFDEAVDYLEDWLRKRLNYFDIEYSNRIKFNLEIVEI